MKSIVLVLTLLVLAACSDNGNPRIQRAPEVHETVNQAAPKVESAGDPKVNILFVVDNSQSMDAHQRTLRANIDRFVDKFLDNPRIDYKIGVVPVYDSRYLKDDADYTYYETVNGKRVTRRGPRSMVSVAGELIPLRDANGQELDSAPYVTSETPDAKNVLKNTITIGTQWGPEAEESFSPVLQVIGNKTLNREVNASFYDKNAYLVVIFLTDADDVTSSMAPYTFYKSLLQAKGNNPKKILIAAALPGSTSNSASCRVDGSGPSDRFPELLRISKGTRANLCSNSFGDTLASLGEKLVEQVGAQKIKMRNVPDANSIVVTYGARNSKEQDRQILVRDQDYDYNVTTNEIVLNTNLNIEKVKNGEIFIRYKEANLRNLRNGRTVISGTKTAPTAKAKP